MVNKTETQRQFAQELTWAAEDAGMSTYRWFISPEGEISLQYQGRQIIVKIVAAR